MNKYAVYETLYYVVHIDTLSITSGEHTLRQERDDISWQSDRDTRFQNNNGNTTIPDDNNVQPKNWQRDITELPNSLQNEDLIVWFRVSAFPNFIKLYARVRVEGMDTLPAGNYTLNVNYSILDRFYTYKHIYLMHNHIGSVTIWAIFTEH